MFHEKGAQKGRTQKGPEEVPRVSLRMYEELIVADRLQSALSFF